MNTASWIALASNAPVATEPDRDWFDWASLIFNTLATSAGLVGLFVAIRAYRVARAQGRKTFELEILMELLSELERAIDAGEFRSDTKRYKPGTHTFARMMILSRRELPTWYFAFENESFESAEQYLLEHKVLGHVLRDCQNEEDYGPHEIGRILAGALHDDIQQAIRKKMK